jgi:hypothetical protein
MGLPPKKPKLMGMKGFYYEKRPQIYFKNASP